jgi:hypothetical protein
MLAYNHALMDHMVILVSINANLAALPVQLAQGQILIPALDARRVIYSLRPVANLDAKMDII